MLWRRQGWLRWCADLHAPADDNPMTSTAITSTCRGARTARARSPRGTIAVGLFASRTCAPGGSAGGSDDHCPRYQPSTERPRYARPHRHRHHRGCGTCDPRRHSLAASLPACRRSDPRPAERFGRRTQVSRAWSRAEFRLYAPLHETPPRQTRSPSGPVGAGTRGRHGGTPTGRLRTFTARADALQSFLG